MDPQDYSDACPDDEVLRAFLLGDLDDADILAVGRHQESCVACESRARALDAHTDPIVDELLRSVCEGPAACRPAIEPSDAAGTELPELPDYEIEGDPLGVGGTGVVYKARHLRLGRVVALKMIAQRPDVVARLLEMEARAVALLQHPNIVQIYDIGRHRGRPFLALEFIEGGPLGASLRAEGHDPRHAAETIRVVAEAVHHAHRQGVVHCDLKPGNILIARDGAPKVADFGMAKWIETDGFWGAEGGCRGTPRYMAPEQAGGEGPVGPATDVYSLGVILYEMLAGRVPHHADSAVETARMVREESPTPPRTIRPAIPRDLESIVLKCLRKAPSERFLDAAALAGDLERFLRGEPIRARPAGILERAWRLVARRPVAWLGAAALALAVWFTTRPAAVRSPTRPAAAVLAPDVQEDGSLRLGAAAASVAGGSLKFENSFGNLGFWHGREDRASWTFHVREGAEYRLLLDYANRNGEAGNRFEVRVDGRRFRGEALGTDGWSDYQMFAVGELRLAPGIHTLEVGPEEPLRGALFDLRAVVLMPTEP
ncbi:serine/threonine-protein kinase [Planctomyces sp. SH-PL62]|uniref:serine/threonine-protein kinase n=1 Tax=Planctomyces sp. SH-PL62 TaxID=1636152 RepID=UPI00078E2B4A|nr:serine/threonine-protein kinase [Planctomyces sp. SH-PL62]AMV39044.1 Serine/threonine-protein kinase PknB [Planctomyces sp. SH-PL62]